jgi:thiamine-phosphate pyrophosphorylase
MIPRQACRLCVITDPELGRGLSHIGIARQALEGGASMIQIRDKSAGLRELLPQAQEIANLCRERGAHFIVNDRLDLALAVNADGVHLGQDDLPPTAARAALGPGKILGVSTHSLEQAIRAAEEGADYLGIGPIFATSTKAIGYEPVGCAMIRQLRARLELPLIAIGAITVHNVGEVIRAGAAGVAVISAIAGAEDVTLASRGFLAAILEAERGPRSGKTVIDGSFPLPL